MTTHSKVGANKKNRLRMRGVEPPRAEAHRHLKPARLPVPPHPRRPINIKGLCPIGQEFSAISVALELPDLIRCGLQWCCECWEQVDSERDMAGGSGAKFGEQSVHLEINFELWKGALVIGKVLHPFGPVWRRVVNFESPMPL